MRLHTHATIALQGQSGMRYNTCVSPYQIGRASVIPRHDRAHGVWHTKKQKGANITHKGKGRGRKRNPVPPVVLQSGKRPLRK